MGEIESSFIFLCDVQVFSYTANKEIRTDDLCLDVSKLNGPVMMLKCHHLKGNQLWEYDAVVSGGNLKSYAVKAHQSDFSMGIKYTINKKTTAEIKQEAKQT